MPSSRSQTIRRFVTGTLLCITVAVLALTAGQLWPLWRQDSMHPAVFVGKVPAWWPPGWRKEFRVRQHLMEVVPITLNHIQTDGGLASLQNQIRIPVVLDGVARKEAIAEPDPLPGYADPICIRTALRLYCDDHSLGALIQNGTLVITSRSAAEQRRTTQNSLGFADCGIEMLKDPDLRARREAAFSLGEYLPNPQTALPVLIESLTDDDPDVRVNVVHAIYKLGPAAAAAVPTIARLLHHETEPFIYWKIIRSVDQLGPAGVPCLVAGTEHGNVGIRQHAVKSLEGLGQSAVLTAVRQLADELESDDIYISTRAALGLRSLANYGTFAAPIAEDALMNVRTTAR